MANSAGTGELLLKAPSDRWPAPSGGRRRSKSRLLSASASAPPNSPTACIDAGGAESPTNHSIPRAGKSSLPSRGSGGSRSETERPSSNGARPAGRSRSAMQGVKRDISVCCLTGTTGRRSRCRIWRRVPAPRCHLPETDPLRRTRRPCGLSARAAHACIIPRAPGFPDRTPRRMLGCSPTGRCSLCLVTVALGVLRKLPGHLRPGFVSQALNDSVLVG